MDYYFTICRYNTEKPRNIEISAPISLGIVLVWNKHVSPRSKMNVFQTYNKTYVIKNASLQIHHCGNHLTLSENINENIQSIEKHKENKYKCSISFMRAFLLVLVPEYDGVSWKHRPLKNQKTFFPATLNQSFIDFKYI